MTLTLKTLMTALAALGLVACSGDTDTATKTADMMDHSKMDGDMVMSDVGYTTGIVVSISPDGSQATIDHGAIEGIGMGAMTMGFGITSGVDLSGYAKGDTVSFLVKKGRDGSYRITAICNTDTDGSDCLDAKMDHSGR